MRWMVGFRLQQATEARTREGGRAIFPTKERSSSPDGGPWTRPPSYYLLTMYGCQGAKRAIRRGGCGAPALGVSRTERTNRLDEAAVMSMLFPVSCFRFPGFRAVAESEVSRTQRLAVRFLKLPVAHETRTNGRRPRVSRWAKCGKLESWSQARARQAMRRKETGEIEREWLARGRRRN